MSVESSSQGEVDGEHSIFQDRLLEGLVGKWSVTGKAAGQQIEQYCEADWVLNHQFLRVHFIDLAARKRDVRGIPGPAEYEAMVFIGFDNMSERYVVHWIDIFGGRFSETLGYGTLEGQDSIRFVFEGPMGPLHNTFTWNSKDLTWSIVIRQKDKEGKWAVFAEETLKKTK